MLEFLKVILLGIVEGITEWLPISSTGHLILVDEFVKLKVSPEFMEMFNVVIQLGAIMAVVVLYFHKLNPFSPKKNQKQKVKTIQLWIKVVVACLPAAVLGLLFDDWMDEHLHNYVVVCSSTVLKTKMDKIATRVTFYFNMLFYIHYINYTLSTIAFWIDRFNSFILG